MNLDESALYRQPEIAKLRDPSQEDESEYRAKQHDLNYVRLDGNIGCMVNGAGLAMATMAANRPISLMLAVVRPRPRLPKRSN